MIAACAPGVGVEGLTEIRLERDADTGDVRTFVYRGGKEYKTLRVAATRDGSGGYTFDLSADDVLAFEGQAARQAADANMMSSLLGLAGRLLDFIPGARSIGQAPTPAAPAVNPPREPQ